MLTEKERKILRMIIDYINRNQYVPTVREITEEVGILSTSTTHRWLTRLEEKGYLVRNKTLPRAMKVLKYIN